MTDLERDIIGVIAALRKGQIVSYGWVAAEAGHPGRARAVGAALQAVTDDRVPWWRVVRFDGHLVAPHAVAQRRRLVAEGVLVCGDRVIEPPVQRP